VRLLRQRGKEARLLGQGILIKKTIL